MINTIPGRVIHPALCFGPPQEFEMIRTGFKMSVAVLMAQLLAMFHPSVGTAIGLVSDTTSSVGYSRLAYTTGPNPIKVALGDLNADGRLDMVIANYTSNTVSILLGLDGGAFGPKTDFATGTNPCSVDIGDLNGDGRPDIAVANWNSSTVSILLGDGAGGFGPRTDVAIGSRPVSARLEDLNGDGKLDLVVLLRNAGQVLVMLGDGAGGFGVATTFATGNYAYSLAMGDINWDGKIDLVVGTDSGSSVAVLLGNGDGTFAASTAVTVGTNPVSVALVDLNGDESPDLVAVDRGDNRVSVLMGDGLGGFGSRTDYNVGTSPTDITITDLNLDGNADLAVANYTSNTVSVLLGDGAGGFASKADFPAGSGPEGIAAGDVDGDFREDLVVADYQDAAASVLQNTTLIAVGPVPADPADSSFAWSCRAVCGANAYTLAWGNNQLQFDAGSFALPETVTVRGVPANAFAFDTDADAIPDVQAGPTRLQQPALVDGCLYSAPPAKVTRNWVEILTWPPNKGHLDRVFTHSAVLTIAATDSALSDLDLGVLQAYRFDTNIDAWVEAPGATTTRQTGLILMTLPVGGPGVYAIGGIRTTVGVPDPSPPATVSLAPVEPNPSHDHFTVSFNLPQASRVDLGLFDVAGRRVARLAQGVYRAGNHMIPWDAAMGGGRLRAGVYLVRLQEGGHSMGQRVVIIH